MGFIEYSEDIGGVHIIDVVQMPMVMVCSYLYKKLVSGRQFSLLEEFSLSI